jgi:hypothetical protein
MQSSAIDRAGILAYISAGTTFEGTAGTFQFDRNGDTSAMLVSGSRVQNGTFQFVKSLIGQQ